MKIVSLRKLAFLFPFAISSSLLAQNGNKVVVIPLESQRPAIEIVDSQGRTIGAATAGDLVAMKGSFGPSPRPVFMVPISRDGFFTPESDRGVVYSGANCTGTPRYLNNFEMRLPVFDIAPLGFDPAAGPHALNIELSGLKAFVIKRPFVLTSSGFQSLARELDGEWRCMNSGGFGVTQAFELEMAKDLSQYSPPFSARSR